MVGFPLTPSPLVIAMPLPAVMVRAVHVFDAVRAAMPVPETPSIAARSSASASVILPDDVTGEPETVIPAAGAVIPTLVTVPAPPVAESVPEVRERPEPRARRVNTPAPDVPVKPAILAPVSVRVSAWIFPVTWRAWEGAALPIATRPERNNAA